MVGVGRSRRLLWLCHANVARSPTAELLSRELLAGSGWQTASAGIQAVPGLPMDPVLAAEVTQRGYDPSAHRSRQATQPMLASSDLVLTMESAQRDWVLAHLPRLRTRTFTLRRAEQLLRHVPRRADPVAYLGLDRAPYTAGDDFADPYGRGPAVARQAVDELDELIRSTLAGLGVLVRP